MSHELILFSALLTGIAAVYLAKQKNKDPFLWFFIGALFGLLGVIYLYFFVSPKQKPQTALLTPVAKAPVLSQKFWYYLDQENRQLGPMSYDALNQAWREGRVSATTYVWNEDLENWKPFGEFIS